MIAPVWTDPDPNQSKDVGADLPRGYAVLMASLTDHGRQRFREELAEAAAFGGEADVLARWWTMLLARHDPGYDRFFGPTPEGVVYQTTAEQRAEVLELRAWWHLMLLRHDPAIREAFARPTSPPSERQFQTTDELRAEVAALAAR